MIRYAMMQDIDDLMIIVRQAQSALKKMNVDQWQNGYPNTEVLKQDILMKKAFVMEMEHHAMALMVCSYSDEMTYLPLKTWISDDYMVIHRFCVHESVQKTGKATEMLEYAKKVCLEKGIHAIRIDTHEKNVRMRRFLEKNQFEERGIIYLKDGSPRIGYELLF